MSRKTVAEAVAKWQSRTQQSQPYYQQGIQNAGDWAAAAVAAGPARDAGLQAAIANKTIDAGITRLGTAAWKAKTLAKGPANWLQGVSTGGPAYSAGLQRVYGYFSQADAAVSNMPRGTYEQNMSRMRTFIDTVHTAAQTAKSQG